MREEHIISYLEHEIRKWTREVTKKKRWLEEAHEDVKKAEDMLQGFKYQLEEAEAVLQHLQEIAVAYGVRLTQEVSEPW